MIVRESLQEFQRGLDPKASMGIGIEEQIKKWYKDNYETSPDEDIIYHILNDNNLDRKTRETWVKFLLKKNYYFEEDEWGEMMDQQIEVISNLSPEFKKELGEFTIKKQDNKFILYFDDWNEFSPYFAENRDLDEAFIETVLSGEEAERYFSYDPAIFNWDDISNFIETNEEKLSFLKELKEKFIELGGDPKYLDNTEKLIKEIFDNEDLEDLKTALKISASSTAEIAEQDEIYKELKNSIINHYELNNEIWNSESNKYFAEISSSGLEKLFNSVYSNEELIVYYPRQYYDADWNYPTFNDEMQNQLSH